MLSHWFNIYLDKLPYKIIRYFRRIHTTQFTRMRRNIFLQFITEFVYFPIGNNIFPVYGYNILRQQRIPNRSPCILFCLDSVTRTFFDTIQMECFAINQLKLQVFFIFETDKHIHHIFRMIGKCSMHKNDFPYIIHKMIMDILCQSVIFQI